MHNIHHILSMFITHICITQFLYCTRMLLIGMLVMYKYAGHRILSGLKMQVSWEVMLSLGDHFLVTLLMGPWAG